MDPASLGKMYIDAVKTNKIESSILMKLPELVTCTDWTKVEILGSVDYISERTKINYNGFLVKYTGGLYYIKKKLAEALGQIDKRFKNVKGEIKVIG